MDWSSLIFPILATGFFLWTLWHLLSAIETRSWSRTRGVVISSNVETVSAVHRANVSYRYTVNGQEVTGNRVYFGDRIRTSWSYFAREIIAQHPAGSGVTVYYDPERPHEAVLVPGVPGGVVAMMCFSIVLLAFAIWDLAAG